MTALPKIIIISGPSGSGKGTVIGALPSNFKKAVSVTTRAMRPGEVDGVDYYFITKEKFLQMQAEDAILEFNFYDGNYYGTPRFEITDTLASGRHVVLDVDVNGAENIKKKYPEALLLFLMAPSAAIQEARLRGRKTNSEESIKARLEQTKKELTYVGMFDAVIINEEGSTDSAVEKVLSAAEGKLPDAVENRNLVERYFD